MVTFINIRMWVLSCILIIFMWLSVTVECYYPYPWIHPKKVRCTSMQYPKCCFMWHLCPSECPTSCAVDCVSCKPVCSCNYPGAVCQDPRFVGGDGITFYFHGKKDRDFCLVTDNNLHINAHFIGKRNPNMKRDFTWVQSLGILFNNHQILISAEKTSIWDDNINRLLLAINGTLISLPTKEGTQWQSTVAPHISITRTHDTNAIAVEAAGNFKITAIVVPISQEESRIHGYNITKENCFAHLEVGFKFYNLTEDVHGVLGQTYSKNYVSRVKIGVSMPVLGGDHSFAASHIFATDCTASRFGVHTVARAGAAEFASIQCKSGMQGRGIVCKK